MFSTCPSFRVFRWQQGIQTPTGLSVISFCLPISSSVFLYFCSIYWLLCRILLVRSCESPHPSHDMCNNCSWVFNSNSVWRALILLSILLKGSSSHNQTGRRYMYIRPWRVRTSVIVEAVKKVRSPIKFCLSQNSKFIYNDVCVPDIYSLGRILKNSQTEPYILQRRDWSQETCTTSELLVFSWKFVVHVPQTKYSHWLKHNNGQSVPSL